MAMVLAIVFGVIALAHVQGVETAKWFRGKSVGKDLLVVRFGDGQGVRDAFGYWVPDPRKWVEAVTSAATAAGASLIPAQDPHDPESQG